ncbi:lactococcin 972 family bacteriocin [Heyndrickxia coagulans]|uniref:lactococcin 972 family bacteriocin n=1 Tax=Heyndrickxia coagulans TaxID=1398 RepID=UPI0023E3AF00|nr:lactococcin 972 family bacteriocin [Heyndrickxia coagulans]
MKKFMAVPAAMLLSLSFAIPSFGAEGGSVDLTNDTPSSDQGNVITPFSSKSVSKGGGTWNYGTEFVLVAKKRVWSNYMHRSKLHSSSCTIGSLTSATGKIKPGKWANSSKVGGLKADTHAYWATY